MKEALYRRKHPGATFTRVRFDQVNNLGSEYVGQQVANYITLTMRAGEADPSLLLKASSPDEFSSCSTGLGQDNVDLRDSKSIRLSIKPRPALADKISQYSYGWVERRASRELNEALEGKAVYKPLKPSRMCDVVFADGEEDNS